MVSYIIFRQFYMTNSAISLKDLSRSSKLNLVCITNDINKIPYKKIFISHLKELFDNYPEEYSELRNVIDKKSYYLFKNFKENSGIYFIMKFKNSNIINFNGLIFKDIYKIYTLRDLIRGPEKYYLKKHITKILQYFLPRDMILVIFGYLAI